MSNNDLTPQDILQQFTESVQGATDEIIELASEDASFEAQEFVQIAVHPEHRDAIESYVFELLKAFGCSAQGIAADDEHSRKQLLGLELQFPQLLWVKNAYKDGVTLEDVNEDLANDKQAQLLAHERLDQWLS